MKITIDTKEDSHEEIRKVIIMLQNIVGDSQIFSNQPAALNNSSSTTETSPFANIFGDSSVPSSATSEEINIQTASTATKEETSESTEDLFAELFSEEELKKMEPVKEMEDEEGEEDLKSKTKSASKMSDIEFY